MHIIFCKKGGLTILYNALSVAHYIIGACSRLNFGISNLKLQKILYFVQAEFLVSTPTHTPCFSERIEAWDFGPVVPVVYHKYKVYGSGLIPSNPYDTLSSFYETINPADQLMIDGILQETADYSASQLVQLTHNQSPWKNAYRQGFNNELTNASLLDFFEE